MFSKCGNYIFERNRLERNTKILINGAVGFGYQKVQHFLDISF